MSRHTGRILLLFIVFFLFTGPANAFEPIVISGCSVSNVGYLNDLAREYEKETGIKVLVRGGGSLVGLTELQANKIDLAASCESERYGFPATDFEFVTVAWDALVFIVHKSNPVNSISPKGVRDIYEGKITNWKQLGGPDMPLKSFISTGEGMGGVGEALGNMLLNGKRPTKQVNSSMQASSAAIWEQLVEKTPEGFASTGFASARKRNVKMLKVNGVLPAKDTVVSGKYPFRRPLFLVIRKNIRPEARKFLDFVLSQKGQKLISSFGIPALDEAK